MASINDLDNPLLLLILNRLSIRKLFTAGHVCVRWNAIRTTSAEARKELILMVGNDAKSYIDESGFQIPEQNELVNENGDAMFPDQSDVQFQIHSFPMDFARLLLTNFTNLTTLTISTRVDSNELDSVINLLEQFNRTNGTLHTLKLYSNHQDHKAKLNNNQNIRPYLRLLSAVNSIGSLRKLTFDVNAKFVRNANYPRIDLPILAQLEEFEFNSADEELVCLYDSITRYAVNNQRLRRIGIHYSTRDFTWLLALPPQLSSLFTHLHFRVYSSNSPNFLNLCRHFSNLTSLEITVEYSWRYTIPSLLHPLTHLPHLISLVINVVGGEILRYTYATANARQIIHFELPSVKVLTINYKGWHGNHHFFNKWDMHLVLPNVQVVRIIRERSLCYSCHTRVLARRDQIGQLEDHCARHMFRNFANSQHLRVVLSSVTVGYFDKLGPRNRRWKWNEIGQFEEEVDEEDEVERQYVDQNFFVL